MQQTGSFLRLAALEFLGGDLVADTLAEATIGVIERVALQLLDALLRLVCLLPVAFRDVERAQFAPGGERVLLDSQNATQHDAGAIDIVAGIILGEWLLSPEPDFGVEVPDVTPS